MRLVNKTNQLDRQAWLLLLVSGLFAISTSLSSTFVNVYLWKIKEDYGVIGWYNLFAAISMATTFILAGKMIKKVDRVIAIRLGVAIHALFYLIVLWLGETSVHYVPILGSLLGIGAGFFWLAFHVLYFEITERYNRDIFNGVNGLLTSGAGIVAPLISGWVITRVDQLTGYRIIFGLSLTIFLIAVITSLFLKRRSAEGSFRLGTVIRHSFHRSSNLFWVNLAMLSQGIREGVLVFLVSLLVFVFTGDEFVLGIYLTTVSAVSLIAYLLVGRFMQPQRRNTSIFIGAVMLGVVVLPFVWSLETWAVFVLGIGAALFYPLYMVPLTSTVFDVIGENWRTVSLRVEFVVVRELALNIGRVLSILAFLWWVNYSSQLEQLRWFILAFGMMQLGAWATVRHIPLFAKRG